jgi:hypothetical protein
MNKLKASLLSTVLMMSVGLPSFSMDDWDRSSSAGGSVNGDARGNGFSNRLLSEDELNDIHHFLYLRETESTPAGCRRLLQYNNYPFSLPADEIVKNTLFFSTAQNQQPSDVMSSRRLSLIQNKIDQLIFEDFPDLRQLSALKHRQDGIRLEVPKRYELHFFGEDREHNLGNLIDLFETWSEEGSFAKCTHLDFAIRNLNHTAERQRVLGMINTLIQLPACRDIETLSLRFMRLTNEDLAVIGRTLKDSANGTQFHSLKRLILSFNDLEDTVFSRNGTLTSLINDIVNLPSLAVVDVRGNFLVNPSLWDFSLIEGRRRKLRERRAQPQIRFGFNGITEEMRVAAASQLARLGAAGDYIQPVGFLREEASFLKRMFNEQEGIHNEFKKQWFVKESTYSNLSDSLLLLRHGAHSVWQTLNMADIVFPDNAFPGEILRHIRNKDTIQKLILKGAFNNAIADPEKEFEEGEDLDDIREDLYDMSSDNKTLVQIISLFPNLEALDLSGNNFDQNCKLYNEVIDGLPKLTSFDFSDNRLGISSEAFFGGINYGITMGAPLRSLNLQKNMLKNESFGSVLGTLETTSKVAFLNVSYNRFDFSGVYESHIVLLIDQLQVGATRVPPLLSVDLSENKFSPATLERIVTSYKERMRSNTGPWPVLKISSWQQSGEHSQSSYVSNGQGLARLARIYREASQEGVDNPWQHILIAPKAELRQESHALYKETFRFETQRLLTATLDLLKAEPTPSAIPLPTIPEARKETYINRASSLLKIFNIPLTEEILERHAKLLLYREQNSSLFMTGSSASRLEHQRCVFKSLCDEEQRARLEHALNDLYSDVARKLEVGRAPTITVTAAQQSRSLLEPQVIIDRSIERLFQESNF